MLSFLSSSVYFFNLLSLFSPALLWGFFLMQSVLLRDQIGFFSSALLFCFISASFSPFLQSFLSRISYACSCQLQSLPRGSMTPARIVGVGVVRGRGNGLVKTAAGAYALEAAPASIVTREDSVFSSYLFTCSTCILWLVISTNMIN